MPAKPVAATDLALHIAATPLIDTHEHLHGEEVYLNEPCDVLVDLFQGYVTADLVVAGASMEAMIRLCDSSDPDIAGRFRGIESAWEKCRYTGFGEGVRQLALLYYCMEELTVEGLEAAQAQGFFRRLPGERLRILLQDANLDHVQIDNFTWACLPDASGPEFFLYDLSWMSFCDLSFDIAEVYTATRIEVSDLASLRAAMEAIFAEHGPRAIAVKSQHAYERTLLWQERGDDEAANALARKLTGEPLSENERLCLGDWCWARGVELAVRHNLPFKLHTGYTIDFEGKGILRPERIAAGQLSPLFMRYPGARFVLMHIAYPYSDELVALAKHFPNVYVDLCWAWSLDPYSTRDFVRRMIHAVPQNKLFAFGGDTFWPKTAAAYAHRARYWMNEALQAEIDEGWLKEREAMAMATRWMQENQRECFDIAGTRAAIRAAM